jgi:hypothetical protein
MGVKSKVCKSIIHFAEFLTTGRARLPLIRRCRLETPTYQDEVTGINKMPCPGRLEQADHTCCVSTPFMGVF